MRIEGDYLYAMGAEGRRFGHGQAGDQYRHSSVWYECNHGLPYDPAPDCEVRRPIRSCSPELLREVKVIDPFRASDYL